MPVTYRTPVTAAAAPCSASGQAPSGVPGWLRSLGRKRVPVQNRSSDDGAPGPTVGAKCRVIGATYANGWLIIVGASKTSPVPGNGMRRDMHAGESYPASGLFVEITPLLLLCGVSA